MDLQEKMSYFENAFNEITAKFHDSHFLKIEKLYNLRYQGLENREPHLIEGFSEEGMNLRRVIIIPIYLKRDKRTNC